METEEARELNGTQHGLRGSARKTPQRPMNHLISLPVALLSTLCLASPSLQSKRPSQPVPIPYDFRAAETLLQSELPNLMGRVAVIVRQDGRDLFRFQAGSIDFDTQTAHGVLHEDGLGGRDPRSGRGWSSGARRATR